VINSFKRLSLAAAVAVSALALVGVSSSASAQAGRGVFTITVDGSDTVAPLTQAAADGFRKATGGKINITVGEAGTGNGFKKFCRGETDISDASRPIQASEMLACANTGVQYVEVPVAFDALTVSVNPGNPVQTITVEQLKKMWQPEAQGRITNWKQVDPSFPDLPLTLYGSGQGSGTFDYFTETVVGKKGSSRTDYNANGNYNIAVQGVATDKGGLGFFGLAYASANKDKVRPLGVDSGKGPVLPSAETALTGKYSPLSRPLFIYVNVASLKKKPVTDFVLNYLQNGQAYISSVGYVPLPADAYKAYQARVTKREAGTAFGGKSDVGGTIQEVLARKLVKTAE